MLNNHCLNEEHCDGFKVYVKFLCRLQLTKELGAIFLIKNIIFGYFHKVLIQKYIFRVVFLSRLTFHTFVSFSTMSILVCLHFELTLSVFQSLHMCLSVCLPICPCLSFLCLFVTWSPSVRISLSLSLSV